MHAKILAALALAPASALVYAGLHMVFIPDIAPFPQVLGWFGAGFGAISGFTAISKFF